MSEAARALEPEEIARCAAELTPAALGAELLRRVGAAIGFDVASHARVGGVDASVGLSELHHRLVLERAGVYAPKLTPLKSAAIDAGGAAIDSEVFGAKRARLRYYQEMMKPDGGRHAMFVVGVYQRSIASVTMLGRTGRAFSRRDLTAMQKIAPVLGLAAGVANARRAPPLDTKLSDPALELAEYVALGLTNREIATALGISPNTVRNRLYALYSRLDVANRAELVARLKR